MTKPVKHFFSSMAGAPVLTGLAGTMIAVLDACLVNGFNLLTLDSLVVSSNVLTGTKTSHGYVVDQVVLIAGANESQLNGEWTITSVTSNTFTAAAPGVSNTTGTGTISVKAAPAGWTKVYSGTNKAVYRSSDATSTQMYLRVDDTATIAARVVGYETMTDVDTGTGPFPTAAQVSGGGSWHKSGLADSTARTWALVADSAGFYQVRNTYPAQVYCVDGFGDYPSEKQGDAYRCFLVAHTSSGAITTATSSQLLMSGTNAGEPMWSPRSYTQIGSAVVMELSTNYFAKTISGDSLSPLAYPSPVSNGIVLSVPAIRETSTGPIRSLALPGLYHTPQATPLTDRDKIENISSLSGRKLLVLASVYSGTAARFLVDITGPWR